MCVMSKVQERYNAIMLNALMGKLRDKNLTLSAMESCTGGGLLNTLTNIPGSSEVVKGGIVAYTPHAKMMFGVKGDVYSENYVYSFRCAKEMAESVRTLLDSDISIGVTGRLDEGKDNKTYVYIIYGEERIQLCLNTGYKEEREEKKKYIINNILKALREYIL